MKSSPTFKIARTRLAIAAAIGGMLLAPTVWAQANGYPNKPVKLIVSFPPGGFADLVGRSLAQALNQAWGQPVIIDNRPGGAGILASELAAKAVPDGYTLYLATDGPFVINPYLYKTLPYHPTNDFMNAALVAYTPLALVVNPQKADVKTVGEFVALAKTREMEKKPMEYASGGSGGPHHLSMEALRMLAGVNLTHIPYKGGSPALVDVVGGQVTTMFSAISTAVPFAKAGKIRILATGGAKRSPMAPEVPTFAEAGFPGFEAGTWAGVVAPKGTPQAIVDKIEADVLKIVRDPQFQQKLLGVGAEPFPGTAAEFRELIAKDQARNSKVIRDLNIKAD